MQTMDLFRSLLKIEKSFEFLCTLTYQASFFSLARAKQESFTKMKNEQNFNASTGHNELRTYSHLNKTKISFRDRSYYTHPIFFLRDAFILNLYDKTHHSRVCVIFKDRQISEMKIHSNQFSSGCCLCAGKFCAVQWTQKKQRAFSLKIKQKPRLVFFFLLLRFSFVDRFCCCAKRNQTKSNIHTLGS